MHYFSKITLYFHIYDIYKLLIENHIIRKIFNDSLIYIQYRSINLKYKSILRTIKFIITYIMNKINNIYNFYILKIYIKI